MQELTKETALDRALDIIHDNRERILNGGVNCIPFQYERSRRGFPGIERASCIGIMADTKAGKSQFSQETFVFHPIYNLYYGIGNYDMNVIIFALEETPERIYHRFISWLLFKESDGKVYVPPQALRSTGAECPKEALEMLQDDHIQDILKFFQKHVIFPDEAPNPTGIRNWCIKFAEDRGVSYYNEYEMEDEFGDKKMNKVFSHYVPNNPNEFNLVLIDTINLVDHERGMGDRETMKKMSEYCAKDLRNKYFFTTITVQQQSFDAYTMDAVKAKHFEPNLGRAGGSKEITRDLDILFSLYCPHRYDVESYGGYDIRKLGNHGLFVKCLINRNGESGGVTSLFFDGAVSEFEELPRANDPGAMQAVYNYCDQLKYPHTAEELAALNPFIKKREPEKPKESKISFINLLFNKWQ